MLDELLTYERVRAELEAFVERKRRHQGRNWQIASMHKTAKSYSAVITDQFATWTAYYHDDGHWRKN